MMFHHFLNNHISIPNPTFRLFDRLAPNGVDQLDPSLTINGQTVTPTFRYKGGDATVTEWPAWGYGDEFTMGGTAGLLNQGSPLLGSNDDSVNINNTGWYQAASSNSGDLTTGDLVFEVIFKFGDTQNDRLFDKFNADPDGYRCFISAADKLSLNIANGGFIGPISDALTPGAWYHVLFFFNRDEASTNGSQIYVNGVASGAGVDASSYSGSISSSEKLTIGASTAGSSDYNDEIAYLACWEQSAWHQAGASGPAEWATIAQDRFNRLIGLHPPKAEGTTVPTVQTRASVAYMDKLEDSNTTRKLYQVGDNWLRKVSRLDSSGDEIQGYLPETTAENLCLQSEDIGTTWTKFDAGDTIGGSVVAPNKSTSTTGGLIADSTDGTHYVYQVVTLTAATYTFSVFVKKGDQDWIGLYAGTADKGRYFDLVNGVLGSSLSGAPTESFIEDWGDGWFRVGISFTGSAAGHQCRVYSCAADLDNTFAGDGSTVSTYLWGAQVELKDFPTSYIPTTTVAVTRDDDQLRFQGDDGNIGGVGSELKGAFVSDVLLSDHDSSLTRTIFQLSDAGASVDRVLGRITSIGDALEFFSRATGGLNGDTVGTVDLVDNTIHNVRCTWITNNFKYYLEGVLDGTPDTAADIPDDLDRIDVGMRNTINQFNGVLSSVKFFKVPTKQG